MRLFLLSLIVSLLTSCVTPPPPPQGTATTSAPPVVSIDQIKQLTKAGVADHLIMSQIRNSRTAYRLSAAEIIDLKNSGVSESLIDFMVNTPTLHIGSSPSTSYSPGYFPQARADSSRSVQRLSRLCMVSYMTDEGWSEEVLVEVQFTTGRQLNQATNTYDYEMFGNYALIWFAKGQVAILKCRDFLIGVGETFDNEDFRRLYMLRDTAQFDQVNSPYPRPWRIRGKEFIRFIDPRATD